MTIPGIDWVVAATIVAEIGLDMSVFPSAGHLAAWAGACPGNNQSAGQCKPTGARIGNGYLKTALCNAATAASRKRGSISRAICAASGARRSAICWSRAAISASSASCWGRQPISTKPENRKRRPTSDAARHVGDRQVRNRGTIGGSLCWNYVAACTPVAALATGATLVLSSRDNAGGVETRSVEIDAFLLGPMQTAREPGELLRAILLTGRRNGRAAPIGNGACPRPHFPSSALASG